MLHCLKGRTFDDGRIGTIELVIIEKIPHLLLDQFNEIGIVNLVSLVDEDNNGRNSDLTGKKDMLLGPGPIAPSVAATTITAPSIWAAPVIIFLI